MSEKLYKIGEKYYPIVGSAKTKSRSIVPLIDIPQMIDEKWKIIAKQKNNSKELAR